MYNLAKKASSKPKTFAWEVYDLRAEFERQVRNDAAQMIVSSLSFAFTRLCMIGYFQSKLQLESSKGEYRLCPLRNVSIAARSSKEDLRRDVEESRGVPLAESAHCAEL